MKKILTAIIVVVLVWQGVATEEITPVISITIEVEENGSAQWTVEKRFLLKDKKEEMLFEEYTKNPEEELLEDFIVKMKNLVESVPVERKMEVKDFSVSYGKESTVTNTYGVIKYQFSWTNFAVKEDDTLVVGDVFEGGYYLAENEILSIKKPEGYKFHSVEPSPHISTEHTVSWEGRYNFESGRPRVVLKKKLPVTKPNGEENGDYRKYAIIATPIIFIALIIAYFYFSRRKKTGNLGDKELLLEIIKKHDGQIYQKELTEKSGFSKSKVSKLLKEMKKEGKIRKIFKGRENLIEIS